MTYIDLHTAAIDWITLTSFEEEFHKYWQKFVGKDARETKIPRYTGWEKDLERGTAVSYAGIQEGREHYMVHLTGPAGDDNRDKAFSQVRQRFAECTRIDLQVTVPMPKTWSQFALLQRLNERGKLTGWRESRDRNGRFQTVYIGARTSDRITRVYMKKADEAMLLRFETEYKKPRSNAVARSLADGKATVSQYLMYELQSTVGDEGLRVVFEPSLSGARPLTEKIRVLSSVDKTEKWLLDQVYPSFQRHINDHDASGRVLAAFYASIKEAMDRGTADDD